MRNPSPANLFFQRHASSFEPLLGLPFMKKKTSALTIPWCTFTDPEVAHVGLNETEAREHGTDYEVTRYDIDELDRAIADGSNRGFVKVLTAPGTDRILGATIVSEHAGDLIAEFILAMKHHLGLNKILRTIHVYPTFSEANKAAAANWRRTHTSPRILSLLKRYHRWRREGRRRNDKPAAAAAESTDPR